MTCCSSSTPSCKRADLQHLATHIGHRCTIRSLDDRALLALQGPKAVDALARLNPGVTRLTFMTGGVFELQGSSCFVTRSGYTGEDGFEISVPDDQAVALARALLDQPEVHPAGLGARDTLRLEAGLCLHGHDIGPTTTPVEAGLTWAIQKVRRPGGARAGHYPGASVIEAQLANGPTNKRVGLVGLERIPVREGAHLVDATGHAARRRHERNHRAERRPADRDGLPAGQPCGAARRGARHGAQQAGSDADQRDAVPSAPLPPRLTSPAPVQRAAARSPFPLEFLSSSGAADDHDVHARP